MSPIDALRGIHDELWDGDRGMDRFAPGVVPGVDISALNLHAVRETALGAYLDLADGRTTRALTAIGHVLALQYPTSDRRWSGTFPVTAEQPEPPAFGAIEWVHYDPNWRQFLGCILALTTIDHRPSLPEPLLGDIAAALRRCVDGEPDGRIAPWYTNPDLMHAWLLGHVGRTSGDHGLGSAGEHRVRQIVERFERFGDVDEYNSPTYDGIDLFALALWVMYPPSPLFDRAGSRMLARIGNRISTLYHPPMGAMCGPYIRAYGLDLRRYVSLAGIWLHVAGESPATVLPAQLDVRTVHVHDLYFLPLVQRLAPVVLEHLGVRAVTVPRRHVQRFGRSCAESLLRDDLAVGWEYGRRHDDSLDQYVPFTAHVDVDGAPTSIGIMVPEETAWIDVRRVAELTFEVRASGRGTRAGMRIVTGSVAVVGTDHVGVGPVDIRFQVAPDRITQEPTPIGSEVRVGWSTPAALARITIG